MKKALIAMSGGIDSSVTALLMQEKGYDCIGINFKMFDKSDALFVYPLNEYHSDVEDAQSVCDKLNMPFIYHDASLHFRKYVIDNFIKTYEKGGTPNPCVQCNKHIKFKLLLDFADKYGCEAIATGHYAERGFNKEDGRYYIKKAKDLKKDQSYFLYCLSQEQIKRTVFPLSELSKDEVRAIAKKNGFVNARKSDSQDICFIHDGDYGRFIREATGKMYPKGKFISCDGDVLGQHNGIINYTIGQRKGLGIALGQPMYVKSKNISDNTVMLSDDKNLYENEVNIEDFNFVSKDKFSGGVRCTAKIRYRHTEQPAAAFQTGDNEVKILFDQPQRAPAKGQSAVLYDNNGIVLGGGIIV